jgi:antibiotic biosynthesis monooxygenase (ABM) superfamily enzyme
VADDVATLLLCARVRPECADEFRQWHVRWQTAVLASPGALSFEFWPPAPPDQEEAVTLSRFENEGALRTWRRSETNRHLVAEAASFAEGGIVMQLVGQAAVAYYVQRGVTFVVVTDIKPGKEKEYRTWADKIQKVQETFPGYIGSFVQPPQHKETGWTTVLRFDTGQHLTAWQNSPQRAALIDEASPLVERFKAQRVDTSFPGWVPNDPATGKPPNVWKTACLVLLTLFPVVMLELKFLNPHLRGLPPALATFTGNAISVLLTTWPLMPLAIRLFRPWLFPEDQPRALVLAMPLVLLGCYALEIAVFWRLLP